MTSKLELILYKNSADKFELWACRGVGKGCKRNGYRDKKKPCDSCFGPLPETMTLGEVQDKLKRGDA